MHIGVDAWNLAADRRGIGRYVREILRCWQSWGEQRVRVSLVVPERPAWLFARRYVQALAAGSIRVCSRATVTSEGFDALWYPWNGMSWSAPGIKVATLHDASLFALPPADPAEREREQRIFRTAAREAARIMTDSHFSKRELEQYLGLDPARVDVVHLGVRDLSKGLQAQAARVLGVDRYILFVGEQERRKGIDTLLAAAALLPPTLRRSTAVVIAGKMSSTGGLPAHAGIDVRTLGHVDDARLVALYRGAAAFVYPSRYEGFGLPVLEAMACGAPVIASNAGGIPEAGGDAALYCPPDDATALAEAIERVIVDQGLAVSLRARGKARAAGMTWEKAAQQALSVFHSVLAGRTFIREG